MLGERGLWYKMNWHENAARVPLIIGFPGEGRPRRVAQSVSTIDLLPTLAEIAGDGAAPDYAAPVDGRSLLPHIAGSGGHDEVLGEYFGEGAIAPLLMIRRGNTNTSAAAPIPSSSTTSRPIPWSRSISLKIPPMPSVSPISAPRRCGAGTRKGSARR
jgi:Arylsulfatase A and related enzymes